MKNSHVGKYSEADETIPRDEDVVRGVMDYISKSKNAKNVALIAAHDLAECLQKIADGADNPRQLSAEALLKWDGRIVSII